MPVAVPNLPEDPSYWFVGTLWGEEDQLDRFLSEGIWQNGYGAEGKHADEVRRMRPSERIAMKSSYVRKHDLPFDVGGKKVSVMRIKAVGTILNNRNDGTVDVAWDTDYKSREWYFYTFRNTVWECDPENESARKLIEFTFAGGAQDYDWWLNRPYFASRYRQLPAPLTSNETQVDEPEVEEAGVTAPSYTVDDILAEGCFVPRDELHAIVDRLKTKLNIVLQGPPGTGKTWLAKRLAYVLIGQQPEVSRSRVRAVQFHPSYSYEDFVRGYRPLGNEGLTLVDGVLLEAVEAAEAEGDRPFVLVIEEINRGNPAQIFGEVLTLLEHDKRDKKEAMELAYRKHAGERVHLPRNLYVIGTMNVADRSLALVDLALRRRFAFVDLVPRFGAEWRAWCEREGGLSTDFLDRLNQQMTTLNGEISQSLGPQFAIGHSFFTPARGSKIANPDSWLRAVMETEIRPLLEEYWFEDRDKAKKQVQALLKT